MGPPEPRKIEVYAPAAFRWNDREAALAFVDDWNFGALVTVKDDAPVVTHLPFLVDRTRSVLRGHLARANPHAEILNGCEQLAVFLGPHAYVSSDWYDDGAHDVPTWNYISVHVAGKSRVLNEEAAVDALLADLVAHEEGRRRDLASSGCIWTMAKIPAADLARMRRAVVAFEIEIARVDANRKLSQNKSPAAAAGVVAALGKEGAGGADVAVQMRALGRTDE